MVAASGPPQFVPAAQLQQSQQALAAVQAHITDAVDEYKSAYPLSLKFDYSFHANEEPFDIEAIYHDDPSVLALWLSKKEPSLAAAARRLKTA